MSVTAKLVQRLSPEIITLGERASWKQRQREKEGKRERERECPRTWPLELIWWISFINSHIFVNMSLIWIFVAFECYSLALQKYQPIFFQISFLQHSFYKWFLSHFC
jgi:hypothetical protein